MTPIGYQVWLQAGDCNDHRYYTLIEPESTLYFIPNPVPDRHGPWTRVPADLAHIYDDVREYMRVPAVEQFSFERIYYPVE